MSEFSDVGRHGADGGWSPDVEVPPVSISEASPEAGVPDEPVPHPEADDWDIIAPPDAGEAPQTTGRPVAVTEVRDRPSTDDARYAAGLLETSESVSHDAHGMTEQEIKDRPDEREIPLEGLRRDAFETAKEHTLSALSDPAVVDELGDFALILTQRAEGLFLPTVQDGVASLPDDYMLTNNFALLPHTNAELEQGIAVGASLLTPTQDRFTQAARAFSQRHQCPESLAMLVERGLIKTVLKGGSQVRVELGDRRGTLSTWAVTDPDNGFMYRTRPIAHTSVQRMLAAHPYQAAGTVCHELIHGDDYEAEPAKNEYDDSFHARTELRAYHVGAVIRRAGGVLAGDGKTEAVEGLRVQYADPQAPFEPTPMLVARLKELGVMKG